MFNSPPAFKISHSMSIHQSALQVLHQHTQFNSVIFNNQKYSLLSKQIHKIEQWNIKNGLYMNRIDEDNDGKHIIDKIINIRFTELKVLSLKNNKIQSIEMLWKAQMPSLTQLFLDGEDNFITDVRSIRKCHFENLSVLSLPIKCVNLQTISQMFLPEIGTIQLNGIKIKWNSSSKWVYKLQSPYIILLQNTGFLSDRLRNSIFEKFRQADFRSRFQTSMQADERGNIRYLIPMRINREN